MQQVQTFIALQAWQSNAIWEALKKADSQYGKFVSHDRVVEWVNTWGDKHEKEMPSLII